MLSLILSVLNKRVTANIKVIAGFLWCTIKSHKSSHGTPVLTLNAMLVVLNLSGINNRPNNKSLPAGQFSLGRNRARQCAGFTLNLEQLLHFIRRIPNHPHDS